MSDRQTISLDHVDLRILSALQNAADLTIADLAEKVGMSSTPVWKRVRRLEEAGVIASRVALLDAELLGLKLTGFVLIRTSDHSKEWTERFKRAVATIPEIVEVHRMAGEVDYLLKVVAPDMAGYDRIYNRLIRDVSLTDVSASFSMERIKATTALPLDYVA